jgi:hypothetical protein
MDDQKFSSAQSGLLVIHMFLIGKAIREGEYLNIT